MALLHIDGFDHYVTADILKKFGATNNGTVGIVSTGGRRNGGYFNIIVSKDYAAEKFVPTFSGSTVIVGSAWKSDTGSTNNSWFPITVVGSDGNIQVLLNVTTQMQIRAYRPNAGVPWHNASGAMTNLLGTSAVGVLPFNSWAYVELKTYLHGSAGTVVVRVNGVTVLDLTGQNTTVSSTSVSAIALCGMAAWDDLYICDSSGSTNNDFLGDCRVDAHYPTADGTTHTWTPSTSTVHYSLIDETAPNTTDYNSTATLNAIDTFVTEDFKNTGGTIYGVQTNLCAIKEDAGVCTMAPVVRPASTDRVGTGFSPSADSYLYFSNVYELNPETSAAWAESEFNATEFGYKKTG